MKHIDRYILISVIASLLASYSYCQNPSTHIDSLTAGYYPSHYTAADSAKFFLIDLWNDTLSVAHNNKMFYLNTAQQFERFIKKNINEMKKNKISVHADESNPELHDSIIALMFKYKFKGWSIFEERF